MLRGWVIAAMIGLAAVGTGAAPALAEAGASARVHADGAELARLMRLPEMLALAQAEAVAQVDGIAEAIAPGADPGMLRVAVERLNSPARVAALLVPVLEARLGALPDQLRADALARLARPQEQRILAVLLSARAAMVEPDADAAARAAAEAASRRSDPRLERVRRILTVEDTRDVQTARTLTAILAFRRGLDPEGGADPADVAALEPEVAAEVAISGEAWLFLATSAVSAEDLDAMEAMSTDPGLRALDMALGAALAEVQAQIAGETGRLAGKLLSGSAL